MMSRRLRALVLAGAAAAVLTVGCSNSSDSSNSSDTTPSSTSVTTTAEVTTTTAPEVLKILVSNDDGVSAPGIDVLVQALVALPNVEVAVSAPATQQSGQGGRSTPGALVGTKTTTISGYPATGVEGYPADSVVYALDQGGIDFVPDVVIAGINEGQNLGGVIDYSGTVGAARAAVARGIPALAISSGLSTFDYAAGVPFVTDWVEEHRAGLLDGTYAKGVVLLENMNVPSCATGAIRGLAEVPNTTATEQAIVEQDCTSTLTDPADDIVAFNNGFVALSVVPPTPTAILD